MSKNSKAINLILVMLCAHISALAFAAASAHMLTPGTSVINHNLDLLRKRGHYILAGDAGRFEIRLGIYAVGHNRPQLAKEYRIPSQDLNELSSDRTGRFAQLIKTVLDDITKDFPICITKACFGAAGPTADTRDIIDDMHAPFGVSAHEIKKHTGLKEILVINDFEVLGLGIEAIDPSEIKTIQAGKPRQRGTKLIIGAGNGLGSGLLLWNDKLKSYTPSPLNYSFVEFSPQTEQELTYNEFLKKTSNNAWGKVLGASAGIVDMYTFLHKPEVPLYQHAAYQEIFDKRETDPACKQAVDMYMKLYIRLMRNAVYAQAPYAGLYITNAVAEKNPELFINPSFADEFLNTGDLSNAGNKYLHDYLQQIPIYLVTSPDLKLYGAALYGQVHLKK